MYEVPNPGDASSIRRQLAWFLAGTFVPVTALAALAAQAGGLAHAPATVPLGMLTPMVSAIAVQKLVARRPVFGGNGLGLRWGRPVWLLLAPAFFAALVAVTFLLSFVVSPDIAATGRQLASSLGHLQLVPKTFDMQSQLVAAFLITIFVGPVLNLPIFLGEEIGWRGFMNPRLITLMGRPGLIAGGVIWALWHLPVILLGHNYPQHPLIGMLVWIPVCVCLNVLLHAVRRSSGSILPCALAHGVINQLGTLILALLVSEDHFVDFLHGPAGLVGLAVLFPAAILAYRSVDDDHVHAVGLPMPLAKVAA